MLKISVCIATHERPELLQKLLTTLSLQSRPADEIVVSDSSESLRSEAIVESFAKANPQLNIKLIHSKSRALPYQRWWAFHHSCGDVVVFLDDDIQLDPGALGVLDDAYKILGADGRHYLAGIGFLMRWEDDDQSFRDRNSFKERWLGTSGHRSGGVTPGGLTVSPAGLNSEHPVEVDQLSGGAMSFRREVIDRIGLLDNLVSLYEQGIGRTEDGVFSFCARQHGKLYCLTQPLVLQPGAAKMNGASRPYAIGGWRLGLTGTWGRAHTMRWLSSNRKACLKAWLRYSLLEMARAMYRAGTNPLDASTWSRLGGTSCGIIRTILFWRRIAPYPGSRGKTNTTFQQQ
jgi:GT2 family glycosyltransferase